MGEREAQERCHHRLGRCLGRACSPLEPLLVRVAGVISTKISISQYLDGPQEEQGGGSYSDYSGCEDQPED